MMIVPAGVKVHLALGYTDMRKGLDGLAMLVQDTLKKDPFSGHLFAFRGRSVQEMCWHLFTWGTAVTIVVPEELHGELAGLAARATAHHRGASNRTHHGKN
jgi:hypothetical protein